MKKVLSMSKEIESTIKELNEEIVERENTVLQLDAIENFNNLIVSKITNEEEKLVHGIMSDKQKLLHKFCKDIIEINKNGIKKLEDFKNERKKV